MRSRIDSLALVLVLSLVATLLMSWFALPSRAETARNIASIVSVKAPSTQMADLTDDDAGYDQSAYDACMDAADTSASDCDSI